MKRILLLLACTIAATQWACSQQKATVSGHITDALSAETLIGATVRDCHSPQGTVANDFGYYTITLPAGHTCLRFSYSGYAADSVSLQLTADTVIDVCLRPRELMREVVVTAGHPDAGVEATGMGVTDVAVSQINHTPALLGETDVVRTLQLLPGVQSGMNGMAGLYVRGGGGDENLIMLDGVPVYKVDHLFGFFSVFTPEAMKKVTFYKGSFPARYAGRLSSVVDVRTRDGDMYHHHGSAGIGLLTSRLSLEGPLLRGRTSYSLSARTSYWDLVMRPLMPDDEKLGYRFYDVNLKLNHRFSRTDRLYLSVYQGQDRLNDDYTDEWGYGGSSRYGSDLHWGNTIASLRWNHVFTSSLFANFTAAYNHYQMKIGTYDDSFTGTDIEHMQASYKSQIRDLTLQANFEFDPTPQHRVEWGAAYTRHHFQPETFNIAVSESQDNTFMHDTAYVSPHPAVPADEFTAYIEDDFTAGPFSMRPGIVASLFHVDTKSYLTLQPRLSFRYVFHPAWSAKAAYTEMAQCVHLLASMPVAMPTDLWVPITRNIAPERSSQYSLGGYFTGVEGWEISLEGYYKSLRGVLEYRDGMSFLGFSGSWESLVASGTGRSVGLELMVRKTQGRTTGWIAYTLAHSTRKFSRSSGVNDGLRFPHAYDRRHTLNLVVNHQLGPRCDLDATWMFHTGEAATVAAQHTLILEPEGRQTMVPYVPSRNNYRLPPSHTLSLGINFHRTLGHHVERTWNISLYNAYNAMNPTFVYRDDDYSGNLRNTKLTKYTFLPLIPSFTLSYKW